MNTPLFAVLITVETAIAAIFGVIDLDSIGQRIVLVAAVLAAIGMIYARVVLPIARFAHKATRAVDVMLDLPEWHDEAEQRLAEIETRLGITRTPKTATRSV